MISGPGQRGQLQVAGQRNGLGLARDALEAKNGGEQALVHHPAGGKVAV